MCLGALWAKAFVIHGPAAVKASRVEKPREKNLVNFFMCLLFLLSSKRRCTTPQAAAFRSFAERQICEHFFVCFFYVVIFLSRFVRARESVRYRTLI